MANEIDSKMVKIYILSFYDRYVITICARINGFHLNFYAFYYYAFIITCPRQRAMPVFVNHYKVRDKISELIKTFHAFGKMIFVKGLLDNPTTKIIIYLPVTDNPMTCIQLLSASFASYHKTFPIA